MCLAHFGDVCELVSRSVCPVRHSLAGDLGDNERNDDDACVVRKKARRCNDLYTTSTRAWKLTLFPGQM